MKTPGDHSPLGSCIPRKAQGRAMHQVLPFAGIALVVATGKNGRSSVPQPPIVGFVRIVGRRELNNTIPNFCGLEKGWVNSRNPKRTEC